METRVDFRQDQKAIVTGLADLMAVLAITPIHRKYPTQAVRVPIIAESADEVHRVAGIFGRTAEIEKTATSTHTRFEVSFGTDRRVRLDVFNVTAHD